MNAMIKLLIFYIDAPCWLTLGTIILVFVISSQKLGFAMSLMFFVISAKAIYYLQYMVLISPLCRASLILEKRIFLNAQYCGDKNK